MRRIRVCLPPGTMSFPRLTVERLERRHRERHPGEIIILSPQRDGELQAWI